MLKKILIAINISTFLFIITNIYFFKNKKIPIPQKIDLTKIMEVKSHPIIDEINKINENVKNFCCESIEATLFPGNIKLSGTLFYEKENKVRLNIFGIFGKELDIGSNEKEFWYWSRRDKQQALYWCENENFYKSRLRTPFNPNYIKLSTGFEIIDLKNALISESEDQITLVYYQKNSIDETVILSVFIDKILKSISGFSISDINQKVIFICNIHKRNNVLRTIHYNWIEEDVDLLIQLKNTKLNKNIDSSIFTIPNYKPKINLINE